MTQLFAMTGLLVLPFWALMIVAPHWHPTQRLLQSPFVALGPALLYAVMVLPGLATILPAVARPDLGTMAALLGTEVGATIAWVHFLAFDLLVGRSIYLDARERGVSPWISSPVLLSTLLLGPLGWLSWIALRGPWPARARRLWEKALEGNPALVWVAMGSALILLGSLALQLIDTRRLDGVSVWTKPAKFGASVALTGVTLAFILRAIGGLRRTGRLMGAMLALELSIIAVQAVRGVPSHFNYGTTLDTVLFQFMAAGITVFTGALVHVTYRAFRTPFADAGVRWGVRFGLVAALMGGVIGFSMPRPTPEQRASLAAGRPAAAIGAHTVGAPDGGPGLPVTGWSVRAGDLRVPHFFGLHGLQVLPLFGWWASRRARHAGRLTKAAGFAFLGVTATLLVQALRGQSVLAPDGITLGMLTASWLAFVAAAVSARRTSSMRRSGDDGDKARVMPSTT